MKGLECHDSELGLHPEDTVDPKRFLIRELCNQSCLRKDNWRPYRGQERGESRESQSQDGLISAVSDSLAIFWGKDKNVGRS